jgi:hypothetical protein
VLTRILALRLAALAACALAAAPAPASALEGRSAPGELDLVLQDAALTLNLALLDPSGNGALDARETARVVVRMRNEGPGRAYGVRLGVVVEGGGGQVSAELDRTWAVLEAGEWALDEMVVTGGADLQDGAVVLRVEAVDRLGRAARPVELSLETRGVLPPELTLIDFGLDDDRVGRSFGDADGIVEVGETIEVKAIVQNRGQGPAEDVTVSIDPPAGLFYMGKESYHLGDLAPGEYRYIDLAFAVPSTYAGPDAFALDMTLAEARGRYDRRDRIPLHLDLATSTSAPPPPRQMSVRAGQRELRPIDRPPPLGVDVETNIPTAAEPNPDAVAVVIGNAHYTEHHRDVPDVFFAARDARVVREYLTTTYGLEKDNILYYEDAGGAVFRKVFGTDSVREGRLAQLVKPGRSDVFVYYSGHGAPDVETRQGYFVPVDAEPGDVRLNGYSLGLFYENLAALEARSITVVIDACFSGGSDAGMLVQAASPIAIRVEGPAAELPNGVVMTSSAGDQISSWYPEKRHGLFTYFFLKGIQGAADADADGLVTAGEMEAYLSDGAEGVPYWARRLHEGRRQDPVVVGDPDRVVRGAVK